MLSSHELGSLLSLREFIYMHDKRKRCLLTVHSPYVKRLLSSFFESRDLIWTVSTSKSPNDNEAYDLQFAEYEEVDWDTVLAGNTRGRASAYCVRKGLTRKAAWAQVVNRW